jgi:predicted DNA-binding transcriptional regulator AlpA
VSEQAVGAERGTLNASDAAAYLGMSVSWLWHSDVPRVRLGRRVLFRVVDLNNYLERRVA